MCCSHPLETYYLLCWKSLKTAKIRFSPHFWVSISSSFRKLTIQKCLNLLVTCRILELQSPPAQKTGGSTDNSARATAHSLLQPLFIRKSSASLCAICHHLSQQQAYSNSSRLRFNTRILIDEKSVGDLRFLPPDGAHGNVQRRKQETNEIKAYLHSNMAAAYADFDNSDEHEVSLSSR